MQGARLVGQPGLGQMRRGTAIHMSLRVAVRLSNNRMGGLDANNAAAVWGVLFPIALRRAHQPTVWSGAVAAHTHGSGARSCATWRARSGRCWEGWQAERMTTSVCSLMGGRSGSMQRNHKPSAVARACALRGIPAVEVRGV